MIAILAALLGGYLAGSIPFGLIVARALGLGDLRRLGSGNIGATNVLRTGHRGAAAATLILDALKGAVPVLAAGALAGPRVAAVAGLGAFVGHVFPVWLGFRGGKGVATYLGILFGLAWPLGIAACATWAAVAVGARISSLAALTTVVAVPLWALVLGRDGAMWLLLLLALAIVITHRANIARLRAGTEPRIGTPRGTGA